MREMLFVVVATGLLIPQTISADEQNAKRLVAAKNRASSTTIRFPESGKHGQIKLIGTPLFRYSDQPRRILDGSFWYWESDGRPVAFQKVELYAAHDDLPESWFYCFASASPHLIQTRWASGLEWKAKQPGIDLAELKNGPRPATTSLRIGLQSKTLARRFSVRLKDIGYGSEEQLRLPPKPIYEYGNDSKLKHGAVYSFASNGTNPDSLLLIELHQDQTSHSWKYGLMQMTSGQLDVSLDNEPLWTAPYRQYSAQRPCKFDRWLFFLESVADR